LLKVFVRVALTASTDTTAHFILTTTLAKPDNRFSPKLVSVNGAADKTVFLPNQLVDKQTGGRIYEL
jgi:hypothetical protein